MTGRTEGTGERETEPLPVVLAGARGHGRSHLVNIRRLQEAGLVRLAGVCELSPLSPAELAGFGEPEQSTDLGGLLERTGARIAVICTPIHTHTELALTAAERGVHTLLEKPTTPSYAEYERLLAGLAEHGTACQVGFQSLGSHAVEAIRELVASGAIGALRGIGAAGAWARDEAYYARAPWAGRRTLDGRDVVDGVLTNPLAHALATALRIDGSDLTGDVGRIVLEQFRANDIEADDTTCLKLTTRRGTPVTVAVTLCAERAGEPYVVVHGERGRITFWYKQDRVVVRRTGRAPEQEPDRAQEEGPAPGRDRERDRDRDRDRDQERGQDRGPGQEQEVVHGRTDLLENLVGHLRAGEPLLVPPERTGAFMRVVEAVRTAPVPTRLPADAWYAEPGERAPRRVVKGVDALVEASARTLATFSELGADWAVPPGETRRR